jgi:peptide/nickel transport system permease protein
VEVAPEPQIASGAAGSSPWRLAWRRLRRNRVALGFLALFFLIVAFALAAPLWGNEVAGTGPNDTHTLKKLHVDGETREVVSPEGQPIGAQWLEADGKFFLGADGRLGRDEMVRLMYGARTSLFIALVSAVLTTLFAVMLALIAGYYRGWVDGAISRLLEVIWAFPVVLLAIALGVTLSIGGLQILFVTIPSGSIWIPILIISGVYVPYMARPLRGEILALREKEFVEAAVAEGAGPLRIMFAELLPNLWTTIIVFFTLAIANNLLLESVLTYLGIGVQPPESSWGSMIASGFNLISSAPELTLIPSTMILLTVLSVNIFGDGLRDALDPRSKVRLEGAHSGVVEREEPAH